MSGPSERNHDDRPMPVAFGSSALRAGLCVGAIVDVVMGAGLMLWPRELLERMGMPEALSSVPEFWPRYVAVFLCVLPAFYLLPALDPARYRGNVAGAIYGRTLGALFYVACAVSGGPSGMFVVLAGSNALFAVYYAIALARQSSPASTV